MTDRNVNDVTDEEVIAWLRSGPEPDDGGMAAIRNLRPTEFLMLNLVQCLAATGKLNSDNLYRLNLNTNKSMLCAGLEPDEAIVGMSFLMEETMLSAEIEADKTELLDALSLTRKQIIKTCNDAVEKLKEIAPEKGWDDGESTAKMYLERTDFVFAKHQQPTSGVTDDNCNKCGRPLALDDECENVNCENCVLNRTTKPVGSEGR